MGEVLGEGVDGTSRVKECGSDYFKGVTHLETASRGPTGARAKEEARIWVFKSNKLDYAFRTRVF